MSTHNNITKTEHLTIIDGCCNVTSESMITAIETVADYVGRRVLILGDITEDCKTDAEFYKSIGRFAVEKKLDLVVAIGELSLNVYKETRPYIDCEWFNTAPEAKLELHEMLTIGDTVLVIAGNSMKFEEIVEYIKEL